MRYAIFSDIHGNREAWRRVLADIRELQADVLVCLGDVVGYGPLPEEVLNEIRAETDNFVIGNHDAAAVGLLDASAFNPHARSVIEWTAEQLSEDSREFLTNVPLSIETDEILFVHAEAAEPARFGYITDVIEATDNFANSQHFVTFVGHTHDPTIFALDNDGGVSQLPDEDCQLDSSHRYIVNVGSVGEPRNPEDLRARYVIYDDETREVFFRRIEFDVEVYRADLAATTLEISPYFLQVVDHLISEALGEHAMAIDMEIPVVAPSGFQTQRRLLIPAAGTAAAKPKPAPLPQDFERKSNTPLILALIGTFVFVVAAIFFWVTASSKSGPPVIASVPQPEPREDAIHPLQSPSLAKYRNPAAEPDPEPEPKPEPAADPKPKPEEPKTAEPSPAAKPVPAPKPQPKPKPAKAASSSEAARFVRIHLPRNGTLSLAEVQIFSGGKNVAPAGKATQSSVGSGGGPERGNDGNTNGVYTAGSVTHTTNEDNPWWEVDLGKSQPIERIAVWNRTDCCTERIDNFMISLLDDRRKVVWEDVALKRPSPTLTFTPTPRREIAEVAWWRFEPGALLADARGTHPLQALAEGTPIAGLAPDEIPLTSDANSGASTLGVSEPADSAAFQLSKKRSFTLEGWILTDRPAKPIFIAGTRTGDANDSQGWHVDIRPPNAEAPNGQMSFFYDNGPELMVALSGDVQIGDLKPHHFAAVWSHAASSEAGEMRLFVDGLQVAAAQVPHAAIPDKAANPFRIGAPTNPPRVAVDEIRFAHTALKPREFLSRGLPPKGLLYADGFNGPAQQLLKGLPVQQSAFSNRTWLTADSWTADGAKKKPGHASALLPIKIESGKFYRLSARVRAEAGNGWIALGFTEKAEPGNWLGANPAGWILLRPTPDAEGSQGAGMVGPATGAERFLFPKEWSMKDANLKILLDTTKPKWTVSWNIDGRSLTPKPVEFPKNPPIQFVGFAGYDKATGSIRDFRLEVAEPEG